MDEVGGVGVYSNTSSSSSVRPERSLLPFLEPSLEPLPEPWELVESGSIVITRGGFRGAGLESGTLEQGGRFENGLADGGLGFIGEGGIGCLGDGWGDRFGDCCGDCLGDGCIDGLGEGCFNCLLEEIAPPWFCIRFVP